MKLFIITIFLLLNINLDSQEDPCGLFGTDDYHLSGYSWDNPNLKYYFRNFTSDLTEEQIRQVFTDAFNKWANVTGLAFTETLDQNEADITMRWHTEGSLYNNNAIFALTYYPTPFHENSGDMEFNENITWKVQICLQLLKDLKCLQMQKFFIHQAKPLMPVVLLHQDWK